MTSKQLDKAEEAAIRRAEEAAFGVTENVSPQVQGKMFDAMRSYINTGIRLMREEIEKQIK